MSLRDSINDLADTTGELATRVSSLEVIVESRETSMPKAPSTKPRRVVLAGGLEVFEADEDGFVFSDRDDEEVCILIAQLPSVLRFLKEYYPTEFFEASED